jgi:hypothetical protein
LSPSAISLALATYIVIGRRYGMSAGVISGLVMAGPVGFFGSGLKRS